MTGLLGLFWRGLLLHLNKASRHKAEEKVDFDTFRVVVRKMEYEGKVKTQSLKISKMTVHVPDDNVKELTGIVDKLATQVSAMNEQLGRLQTYDTLKKSAQFQVSTGKDKPKDKDKKLCCWHCGDPNYFKPRCPKLPECYMCHRRGHIRKKCLLKKA